MHCHFIFDVTVQSKDLLSRTNVKANVYTVAMHLSSESVPLIMEVAFSLKDFELPTPP